LKCAVLGHRWAATEGVVLDMMPPINSVKCLRCGVKGSEQGGKYSEITRTVIR